MSAQPKRRGVSDREWASYRRLLVYAEPYKARLIVGCLAGVLAGLGMGGGMLNLLQKNLDNLQNVSTIPQSEYLLTAALLPVLFIVLGIAEYLNAYLVQWVGNRVVMDVRNRTFRHLHTLSLDFYSSQKTGEMISRTINDSTMLERAVSTVMSDLAKQPATFFCALGYLVYLEPRLALYTFIILPLSIVPVILFGKRVRRHSKEGQQHLADLVSILQETLSGIQIVKAFGMEDREVDRFKKESSSYFRRTMKVVRAKAAIQPIIQVIAVLGFVAVWVYSYHTDMSVGSVITFLAGLFLMYDPVKKLGRIHLHIQQSAASADRIFEILDTPIKIADREGASELDAKIETVDFENVRFAYDKELILKGVSLKVKAGDRIAIVGTTGGGKSTFVNLLSRFYDVTDGAVLVNGTDVRDLTVESLRARIGMVTQEMILFNDTIAANIAYGTTGLSQSEIEAAARRAHAHEFISEFEAGYQTVIGDRGTRLSGGQKQRLSIARAILRNPPIMILDEATSNLDTESERLVQSALDELMTDRTVFAIAHRFSTIVNCHCILVIEAGLVVERGTHDELLALGGRYKHLYEMQFKDGPEESSAGT